jgi:hypothetical protein
MTQVTLFRVEGVVIEELQVAHLLLPSTDVSDRGPLLLLLLDDPGPLVEGEVGL